MYVIGIDPGPVTGIALLFAAPVIGATKPSVLLGGEALQVTHGAVIPVLDGLATLAQPQSTRVAIERFVVGRRAAQSSSGDAGEVTRELIGVITHWANQRQLPVASRSAADVKPWATDARLGATGLLDLTKSMRHARDAARHALFCAVKDFGLTDPLSRKAGA